VAADAVDPNEIHGHSLLLGRRPLALSILKAKPPPPPEKYIPDPDNQRRTHRSIPHHGCRRWEGRSRAESRESHCRRKDGNIAKNSSWHAHRELLIGQPTVARRRRGNPYIDVGGRRCCEPAGLAKIFASRTCSCVNFERATFLIRRQIFSVQKFARSRRKFPRIQVVRGTGTSWGLDTPSVSIPSSHGFVPVFSLSILSSSRDCPLDNFFLI